MYCESIIRVRIHFSLKNMEASGGEIPYLKCSGKKLSTKNSILGKISLNNERSKAFQTQCLKH